MLHILQDEADDDFKPVESQPGLYYKVRKWLLGCEHYNIYARTHTTHRTQAYMHTRIHAYTYTHTHTFAHMCAHYTHRCTHMYTHVYTCTHTRTHTNNVHNIHNTHASTCTQITQTHIAWTHTHKCLCTQHTKCVHVHIHICILNSALQHEVSDVIVLRCTGLILLMSTGEELTP